MRDFGTSWEICGGSDLGQKKRHKGGSEVPSKVCHSELASVWSRSGF